MTVCKLSFVHSLFLLFWWRNDGADPLLLLVSRLVLTSLRRARIWANGVTINSSSNTFLVNCLYFIRLFFRKLTQETPKMDLLLLSCYGGRILSGAFHQPWEIPMKHLGTWIKVVMNLLSNLSWVIDFKTYWCKNYLGHSQSFQFWPSSLAASKCLVKSHFDPSSSLLCSQSVHHWMKLKISVSSQM